MALVDWGPSGPVIDQQVQQPQATHDFNPATGLSREAYRDAWMGSGIGNIQQMQDWLSKNGGQLLAGNGTVMTPYGDLLDMGTAFRTGNGTPGWTPVSNAPVGGFNAGVMNNAGAPDLGSILQFLTGMAKANAQTSAMPYNPYANQQQQISNYFGNMTPTQTNGTLIGTSFAPSMGAQNNMQMGTNQAPTQKKSYNAFGQPAGAETNYSQKNENFNSKPLPNSNLPGNF